MEMTSRSIDMTSIAIAGVVLSTNYDRIIVHIKSQDVFSLCIGKYGKQVAFSNITGTVVGSYQLTDDLGEIWLADYRLIGDVWKRLMPESKWSRIQN